MAAATGTGSREGPYPRARGLYGFTRAILGDSISDNEIARRWKIDPRVFNDLKHGRVAVPKIERLRDLAVVLGVNEHFVYAIAGGAPWRHILRAAKRDPEVREVRVRIQCPVARAVTPRAGGGNSRPGQGDEQGAG